MSGLPARVIQVLKDYLPAELALIDAEEADGITTPAIANDHYHEWAPEVIFEPPACAIRIVSSEPVATWPDGFGRHVDAIHRLEAIFICTHQDSNQESLDLQKIMARYIAGALRVLTVMYEGLQTSADPTRVVTEVRWEDAATYGPEGDQVDDNGAVVRTATLPIAIRQVESR